MTRRILPGVALALAFSVTAVSGNAQIKQRPAGSAPTTGASAPQKTAAEPVISNADGASYGVQFEDELLSAIADDGTIPRIVVRPVRGFGQLNRPRVSFVRELSKSVEVM